MSDDDRELSIDMDAAPSSSPRSDPIIIATSRLKIQRWIFLKKAVEEPQAQRNDPTFDNQDQRLQDARQELFAAFETVGRKFKRS
ncbi:hypothetical protein FRB90_012853, partial [Tulasnella sp. 427]